MNKLSKIIIIPVLIAMVLVFSMSALAVIHTKWVAGDFIYYDESDDIFAVRDDTDGVRVYDDMNLTFGDGDDATIEWDADGTSKLIITCSSGFTVAGALGITGDITLTGALGVSDTLTVTIAAPTAVKRAVYGVINATVTWTSGNLCAVRGKVNVSGAGNNIVSATGVWAGLDFADAIGLGTGLTCAINAEVSSDNATCPNAIVYIQSLPSTGADFSNVPYLVFSETRTGTGSNILFEVGHAAAKTTPEIGDDELFYNDTLRIAVNKVAGTRTKYYIPLSTVTGTFTTAYPIVSTYGGGDASANAFTSTITDPTINATAETSYGFAATINSTDAVGWTDGTVAPIFGHLKIATLSPGKYATGAAGWFVLEYDSVETADGIGMTNGLYVKVLNEIAARAPSACLWLEDVTTGDGDARKMPMIVITSIGDAVDKSEYALSLGFAAAGTTVSTGDGATDKDKMIITGGHATTNITLKTGIQIIVNGAEYYIPIIATDDWVDDGA